MLPPRACLFVKYYLKSLSLKLHKNPSFGWGIIELFVEILGYLTPWIIAYIDIMAEISLATAADRASYYR